MEKLRAEGFVCTLPASAVLFAEGQSPRGVHMLVQGHVKLTLTSSDGKTLILKVSEPGEILGMANCVTGHPYEMTAQTLQNCQVNFVKREDFVRLLREQGPACLEVAQHLSRACHTAYDQIRALGLAHSVTEKLARFLLDITFDSRPTPHGDSVELGLTHEEIAQTIGTSRETVTRLLAEFRKKRLASLKGSVLRIQDKPSLERLAGMAPAPSRAPAALPAKRGPASVASPSLPRGYPPPSRQ